MINVINSINSKSCNSASALYELMLNNCENFLKLVNDFLSIASCKKNNIESFAFKSLKNNFSKCSDQLLSNEDIFQPFISTVDFNGIQEKIVLTSEEISVLEGIANNTIDVNKLYDKADMIRSFIVKGLMELDDNGSLVLNKNIDALIKTQNANGCLVFDNNSDNLSKNNLTSISWRNFR